MLHIFHSSGKRYQWLCLLLMSLVACSCNKATVNFGEEALEADPNIIYSDTMTVVMSTFQTDSMTTWGDTLFMAGIHTDTLMGKYEARAYMQIEPPATNPVNGCSNCSFDSIVFIARYSGASFGDTTEAFTLNVHRLTERMISGETAMGYNTSAPGYDQATLGSATLQDIRPSRQEQFTVKLSDELGLELYDMLKRNSDTITDKGRFYKYFNGIVLTGAGAQQRSLYYFTHSDSSSGTVVRLYYKINGITPVQQTIDFGITGNTFQFNSFSYDRSSTALSAFTPRKKEIIAAAQTGNRSFLHGNGGLYTHLRISSLLALKELHPYVKVVKAELEITPPLLNYGPGDYYSLPPALALYTFYDDIKAVAGAVLDETGTGVQTGNLVTDYLYHKDTKYTYDLTSYVNSVLTTGTTAERSFLLMPASNIYESRLILDATATTPSVKLKLYVLGL